MSAGFVDPYRMAMGWWSGTATETTGAVLGTVDVVASVRGRIVAAASVGGTVETEASVGGRVSVGV